MGNIYSDMAGRTGGEIYVGVVGPVRSGKSTFIKRFMETLVIPNIRDNEDRKRTIDELPQSATGKTVMTTEPKFIPDTAVRVDIGDNTTFSVRMVDCVGYMTQGALGSFEDGQPRMVNTPWHSEAIPFEKAAEFGTQKVINEHSTIGIVVTTDGSIGELPRESYVEAERRVINELKAINKPFAVILNTLDPCAVSVKELSENLSKEYDIPVIAASCLRLGVDDINEILKSVLLQFPLKEIGIKLPKWINALDQEHKIKNAMYESIFACAEKISKAGDVKTAFDCLYENEYVGSVNVREIDLGKGAATVDVGAREGLLYTVISEKTGCEIKNDGELIELISEFSKIKKKYEKVEGALQSVKEKGYGIVTPDVEDLRLEEPEIVKNTGGYGVKLRASAPSIHMIMAEIETEVSPIVGTEKQSEELVKYLLKEFEQDPQKIWESNIFGKNLHELVNEGLHTKLEHMPEQSRTKLSQTLQKIINEGSGGLICIIL